MFKLDPVHILDEPDRFRRAVRDAAALSVARLQRDSAAHDD